MGLKLDQMTKEQRIKYLKDTDHLVVKWVNGFLRPDGTMMYHRENLPHITSKLCEATVYDMKYFSDKYDGFTLMSVTKKELFAARLANK